MWSHFHHLRRNNPQPNKKAERWGSSGLKALAKERPPAQLALTGDRYTHIIVGQMKM
jgi:hypothetical protein